MAQPSRAESVWEGDKKCLTCSTVPSTVSCLVVFVRLPRLPYAANFGCLLLRLLTVSTVYRYANLSRTLFNVDLGVYQ